MSIRSFITAAQKNTIRNTTIETRDILKYLVILSAIILASVVIKARFCVVSFFVAES